MKKLLALVLALCLTLCATAALADTVGLGVSTCFGKSTKDATADGDGAVQLESTICVLSVDAEGKITYAKIDVAQTSVKVSNAGAINKETDLRTKLEKLEDYNMKKRSPIGKEWYEQSEGLCAWMIGKTMDEVKAGVEAKDADLLAVCTISTSEMIKAAELAYADATK